MGRKSEEKTIVRPTYSYLGEYKLSTSVISDIVIYSSKGIKGVKNVDRVAVGESPQGKIIELIAYLDYGVSIPEVGRQLQMQIASRVKAMTALNLNAVNIEVRTAK